MLRDAFHKLRHNVYIRGESKGCIKIHGGELLTEHFNTHNALLITLLRVFWYTPGSASVNLYSKSYTIFFYSYVYVLSPRSDLVQVGLGTPLKSKLMTYASSIGGVLFLSFIGVLIYVVVKKKKKNSVIARTMSLHDVNTVHKNPHEEKINYNPSEMIGLSNPQHKSLTSLIEVLGVKLFSKNNLEFDQNLGEGAFGKVSLDIPLFWQFWKPSLLPSMSFFNQQCKYFTFCERRILCGFNFLLLSKMDKNFYRGIFVLQ